MTIKLYHGTSLESATRIMKEGFKSRDKSGISLWENESQPGFVYLTRAYPFFYAVNAAGESSKGAIIKVEVDIDDLYPDEDFLYFTDVHVDEIGKLSKYKFAAEASLKHLGNVAIRPEKIKVLGMKEVDTSMLWRVSDPSITIANYKLMGHYYRTLTDTFWEEGDWQNLNMSALVAESLKTMDK